MRTIELNELRSIQLEILNAFDSFCTENGLIYFLTGGTLLGAIRHKGYIPWDDDIDVAMPRADYEKLVNISKSLPFPYCIEKYSAEKEKKKPYIYTYLKAYDLRTTLVEFPNMMNYSSGVYIDIFPLDNLPNDLNERKKAYRTVRKYVDLGCRCNVAYYIKKNMKISSTRDFFKKVFYLMYDFVRALFPPNFFIIKADTLARNLSIQETRYVGCIVAGYGEREAMLVKDVFPPKPVEFEGKYFPGFNNPDAYLSQVYGDYMSLPPEEKRMSNHIFKAYWKD